MSGQWEATYTADGINYNAMNMGSTIDQNAVVLISDISASGGSYTNSVVRFGSTVDYTNVISFEIIFGAVANLTLNFPNGSRNFVDRFTNASGYLLGSSRVDLPSDNNPGQPGTVNIYNNYTSSYDTVPLFLLTQSFEPMNLNEFIINTSKLLNYSSNSPSIFTFNNIKTAITRIKITFANLSDTEIIKNQLEIANNYLSKIDESIQQGTQDIIENQDQNTQDIIDNQNQNTHDIIDNQDQNTQDIIDNQNQNTQDILDKEQQLWDDTYNPSDDEISDMQDNISGITEDLKKKLGLFTFIDDTLSQFFSLLDPDQVSSTNMIFPSLSITVYGESYEFVKQTEYDISSLQEIEGFDPLFTALHFFSAGIIYWALIAYLQSVFKRIFASGSGDEQ